jgi:hypothetical protein
MTKTTAHVYIRKVQNFDHGAGAGFFTEILGDLEC